MTLLNHSATHRTYLAQAVTDWAALEVTAGNFTTYTIEVGSGELGGTDAPGEITAPIIHISEIQGCPYYDERGTLIVGYRIRFKIQSILYSDGMESLTKLYESLAYYLDQLHVLPSTLGDAGHTRIDRYWIGMKISPPYLTKVIDFNYAKDSALSNGCYFDIKIRTCNLRRSISFPTGDIV